MSYVVYIITWYMWLWYVTLFMLTRSIKRKKIILKDSRRTDQRSGGVQRSGWVRWGEREREAVTTFKGEQGASWRGGRRRRQQLLACGLDHLFCSASQFSYNTALAPQQHSPHQSVLADKMMEATDFIHSKIHQYSNLFDDTVGHLLFIVSLVFLIRAKVTLKWH